MPKPLKNNSIVLKIAVIQLISKENNCLPKKYQRKNTDFDLEFKETYLKGAE